MSLELQLPAEIAKAEVCKRKRNALAAFIKELAYGGGYERSVWAGLELECAKASWRLCVCSTPNTAAPAERNMCPR
uniref:Uncharacterized protein n=1 Tax=Knipowitschia caucasica TaxID=637954 RepID=A0AAV2IZU4_KNICA